MTGRSHLEGVLPADRRPVAVEIEDGRIAAIEPATGRPERWIAPGLLDVQVNGYAGHDVNAADLTPEGVAALARELCRVGVTGWCPTIITASPERMLAALRTVAAACREDPLTNETVLGCHLEGPHLSAADGARGVHDLDQVRPPDVDELTRWRDVAGNLVAIVTLAPEHEGARTYIRALAGHEIVAAVGHTAAEPHQIHAAADSGATLSTHLGNGAPATLPRHPNQVWSQLAEDRMYASFIADGHHLAGDVLTSMLRAKTVERALLVSDSTALGGLPAGEYETPVGGRVRLDADGRLGQVDSPYLAGAAANLAEGVARVTDLAGVNLATALRLATANPARLLGRRARGRGTLRVGARADLVTFDWSPGDRSLAVHDVVVAGRFVGRDDAVRPASND